MKLKNLAQILLENGINAEYVVTDHGAPENPGNPGNIVKSIEIDSDQKVKFFNFIDKHNDDWKMTSKDNVRLMEEVRFSTTDKYPTLNCETHFKVKDVYGITIYKLSGKSNAWSTDDAELNELCFGISMSIDNNRNYHLGFDVCLGGLK